jgi:hypothetical protein
VQGSGAAAVADEQAADRIPLASAASVRAESCCSCHRKAEASPCRTSIDHHLATAAVVRPRLPPRPGMGGSRRPSSAATAMLTAEGATTTGRKAAEWITNHSQIWSRS